MPRTITPIKSLILALLAFLAIPGCRDSLNEDTYRIAVIPKGTTHVFWKSVHAGALTARNDLAESGVKVEIRWKGPLREDDRSEQVGVVETFIGQRVDGIILAPLDRRALVAPVQMARQAGIPTVIFDSTLDDPEIVSYVATDNFRGGQLAGHYLAKQLHEKGRIIVLRYQIGSASTEDREAGFFSALEHYPEIEILSSNQYAGATRDTAFTASQNLVNRFAGQIEGVFTPNESSTNGMLLALRDLGLAGKVPFVGFDGGEQNLSALASGDIHALVVQDPFKMGYQSVQTLVAHLRGESVAEVIDTGVIVITRKDLDDPEIQRRLHPPLEITESR